MESPMPSGDAATSAEAEAEINKVVEKPGREVSVTRTYLQMMSVPANIEADVAILQSDPSLRLERVYNCPVSFCLYLYSEVGRDYYWTRKLKWSKEKFQQKINEPSYSLHVLYKDGAPAGYFELLQKSVDNSMKLAYFGLLPEYRGMGLGKALLAAAVQTAWRIGGETGHDTRVWVHTCSLDDPAAYPNYIKRGFVPYKANEYTEVI